MVLAGATWNENDYLLMRLGFGIASASKIMTKIAEKCLAGTSMVCSSYINNIYVQGPKENAKPVRDHLAKNGLMIKPAETVGDEKSV